MFKKLLPLLLALLLALSILPAAAASDEPVSKSLPIYTFRSTSVGNVPVVFFDGCMDIPYCSVDTVAKMLEQFAWRFGDSDYSIESGFATYQDLMDAGLLYTEYDPDTVVYYLLRENNSLLFFDYDNNEICFSNRDLFVVSSYAVSGGDLVAADGLYYLDDGNIRWNDKKDEAAVNLYHRVNGSSFKREGDFASIRLSDYNIFIQEYDDTFYLPLATVSDVILPYPVTFNGEALFAFKSGGPDKNTLNDDGLSQYDLYYLPGERERSEELALFTYYELCLMLDNNYGLKQEHGITGSFDDFLVAIGLEPALCSTDTQVFTNALYQLLSGYFGDLHSNLSWVTPYSGGKVSVTGSNTSISLKESDKLLERFRKAREAAGITVNGEIVNGYTEIGDTAFVTFDSFTAASTDYYNSELWGNFSDIYMSDTISLVVWSHAMIHRENSPIRKVVIDLSCNGGGSLDACMFIASWVLGSANLSLENVNTGAQYTTVYWVDVNLNGDCGYDDELGVDDLDVYCLVNGNSFSCGNLLPTLFKQDGRVTLIGQTTGGGACLVRHTAAADGTLFSLSDFYRLSIVKNGSFYSIDRGVEADIPLRKPASFYDREALAEYLDTIR